MTGPGVASYRYDEPGVRYDRAPKQRRRDRKKRRRIDGLAGNSSPRVLGIRLPLRQTPRSDG